MSASPICAVFGVGPGLGSALVHTMATAGFRVASLSRQPRFDVGAYPDGRVLNIACDLLDPASISRAFAELETAFGGVDWVFYNAGNAVWGDIDSLKGEDLLQSWQLNTLGLFHVAQHALPHMRKKGGGVIGITGASAAWRGRVASTAFAQGKAAQRSLAQSLARKLGPEGIHVFYTILDGQIWSERTRTNQPQRGEHEFLKPEAIAAEYLRLAQQDPSTWTFELDMRPYVESW